VIFGGVLVGLGADGTLKHSETRWPLVSWTKAQGGNEASIVVFEFLWFSCT